MQKCGRSDGSSYKAVNKGQELVEDDKPLICNGYFSWWGVEIDPEEVYDDDDHNKELSLPDLSDAFITDDSKSKYGTVKFAIQLNNLIASYCETRECQNSDVVYRKGGTLKYQFEICRLIIVSIKKDSLKQFLEYSLGQLEIKCPYSKIKGRDVKWNNYVFAFYFPNESNLLLDPRHVNISSVKHSEEICQFENCPDKKRILNDAKSCCDVSKLTTKLKVCSSIRTIYCGLENETVSITVKDMFRELEKEKKKEKICAKIKSMYDQLDGVTVTTTVRKMFNELDMHVKEEEEN